MKDSGTRLVSTDYSPLRKWVKSARAHQISWDTIKKRMNNTDWFRNNIDENFWPEDSQDIWPDLVDEMMKADEARQKTKDDIKKGVIKSNYEINDLDIPEDDHSCWQQYRRRLSLNGLDEDSITRIEQECLSVLNLLSNDTEPDEPIKGLVVGNIQSGKTSNMAGVMAMAADHGWNMFIVLSGMVNNLNDQTLSRLERDLNSDEDCEINWEILHTYDLPSRKPSNLKLKTGSTNRYLIVTIKQRNHLLKILNWLNKDENVKEQLKILLIDDEADQASSNSVDLSRNDRHTINRLVVDIVNCRDRNDNKKGKYGCMNYVSYTATPYANFLSDSSEEGLYPRNFVILLTPSNTYIGPREIFGSSINQTYCGMDIIRHAPEDGNPELDILPVHEDPAADLPLGLKRAICWFICSVACLRFRGMNKPKTMLIHTSFRTSDHDNVARAVKHYLNNNRGEIKNLCREVFSDETSFGKDQFLWDDPDYGRKDDIEPYPKFIEISSMIDDILNEGTSQTYLIDEDIQYSKGINLCVDNSKNSVIEDDDDDSRVYHPRLIYPDSDSKEFNQGLAFIVIGGNTISRGLTLEGLCCTYFARTAQQGDTLMQMSRWFGYRLGYELYPRIWMSDESFEDFCQLTSIDEELRDFIRRNYKYFTPENYPPRIRKFPPTSRLKKMTSKDKAAINAADFAGTLTEVTVFDKDDRVITENESITIRFLKELDRIAGTPVEGYEGNSKVWRNISEETVGNYLQDLKISSRARNYNTFNQLRNWSKERIINDWNVVLAGVADTDNGPWGTAESKVNRVERTAKKLKGDDGTAHIGSLSTATDRYKDILNASSNPGLLKDCDADPANNWGAVRNEESFGVYDTPLLLIYPIRGDSMPKKKDSQSRLPLGLKYDQTIIGVTIIIPGSFDKKDKSEQYITIEREHRDGPGDSED